MNLEPKTGAKRPAFTFVEVTMAIVVLAVGVLAVLGAIPRGLQMVGEATDTATEARISQFIAGEILLADWEDVDGFDGERRYFDSEGIALISDTRGGLPYAEDQVAYVAKIEIRPPEGTVPAAQPSTKSGSGSASGNRDLKRLQVHVAAVPLTDFAFTDPQRYRTYATVVARMDQ